MWGRFKIQRRKIILYSYFPCNANKLEPTLRQRKPNRKHLEITKLSFFTHKMQEIDVKVQTQKHQCPILLIHQTWYYPFKELHKARINQPPLSLLYYSNHPLSPLLLLIPNLILISIIIQYTSITSLHSCPTHPAFWLPIKYTFSVTKWLRNKK